MLNHRELGQSGLHVAPLAFGGNVFGWTADEATSFRLLDAFVDAGLNLVDTADVYSRWAPGNRGGESETIIGKWIKQSGKRSRIVLATKVGMDMGDGKVGLSPRYIRQAVEDSLRRLQTDHIDLYQSHKDDPETPLADTLGEYARLIEEGKVRAIGASNYSGARLAEALAESAKHSLPRYQTLQPEYNLYERQAYESELEPVVRDNALGVITYYPLASGFLTGKYRAEEDAGKSVRGATIVKRYLNPRGKRILAALDAVSERLNATPAQVALAWQTSRPNICAPLASATSLQQLEELVKAAKLKLDSDAIATLNEASAYDTPTAG
ncbi:aldo/keto reductase [Verticiella sediminum]|uniref:Aldo/keto reductase n=1 Tax=Verticiella sediminum TaxID=1247510 RepID=A0A556ABZ0_9BURK|nr:aldo/keto reductase [Verticiella sediminum]TSH90404.1 aldo/keto reductase [Verticiella sediminum]